MTTKRHKCLSIIMFSLITSFILMADVHASSGKPNPSSSCEGIKLCTNIEGRDFEMIKFASMGSELIILYDKNKSGEIYPTSMESLYERSRGNVNDAIFYLSQGPDYDRFTIRKARKSTGWFKAEDIDSVYVVLPKYKHGPADAAEYSFFEKEGQLRVSITGRIHMSND
jgi:hypothetical protein